MAKIQYRYRFGQRPLKTGCGSVVLLAVIFYVIWVLVFSAIVW